MAKWSGKTRGGTFGYKFFILLIKNSNQKVTYFFLRIVAFYFFLFVRNKNIKFYFRDIHKLKGLAFQKALYRNYLMLGEVLVDKIAFLVKPRVSFTFDYEGEEYLHEMAAGGKGGMLIGAHMGNWELAGNLLDRIDNKVNVLMLDAEHQSIKALLESYKVLSKFEVILIRDDFSHLIKIREALERNEFVVMHGDRYVDGNGVIELDFMAAKAKFPVGPLYMASKFAVPVSFVYTLKDRATHYHFYATKPEIFPYPASLKRRREDIRVMVEKYVSNLEFMVKRYPTQWFNYFPFWEDESTAS
ncbi:MAG TPA: lipid A biosynthesis acyltransferase [Marinilabiliaceae bacterium]|nr:lipid A biosynthesis acyltransferase [Marinilabiliaceae bacterium]HBX89047.1 lipid A biosynthesis acyltransferase [Marinilabiliaceae bacterium]